MELYLTTYQLDKAAVMAADEKLADQVSKQPHPLIVAAFSLL